MMIADWGALVAIIVSVGALIINLRRARNENVNQEIALLEKRISTLDEELKRQAQEAKDQLKEARDEFTEQIEQLMDLIEVPAAFVDEAGNFINSNSLFSDTFGYEPEELRGQRVTVIIPADDRAIHNRNFRLLNDEEIFRTHYRDRNVAALHRDGHTFDVTIHLSRRPTGHGFRYLVTLK